MKYKGYIRYTIFAACLFCWGRAISQPTAVQAFKVDSLISRLMSANNIPGLALTIYSEGVELYTKGYGYSDLEAMISVDPTKTKFRVGSISKPFTADAIAQLVEQGKLDLDAPIQKYIDFPQKEKGVITTRLLAGHLAGIRHYQGSEFLSSEFYPTVERGLTIFSTDSLLFPPGDEYSYSSYGWNVISSVIEGISEVDFLTYMDQNVFKKLGMINTEADINSEIIPHRSGFYVQNGGKVENAPYVDNSYKWAGGGFISTSSDVAKFADAHIRPGFLQQSTLQILMSSQKTTDGKPTGYGLGWRSAFDEKGFKWVGHSGGSVGGTSQMIMYPDHGSQLVVAILTNMSNVRYNGVQHHIAWVFLEGTR